MLFALKQNYPHRSVILVAAAIAFSLLGDQALYSVLPIHFQKLGLMPFQVGVLLSVNRWIRLLTNHLAEKLTRITDPVVLLTAALILGSLLTFSYGYFPFFLFLLSARLLWGLSWSVLRQIGVMTAINSASTDKTARTIGFFNGIVRIGAIGGLLVGALLYDSTGFTQAFLILAAVSLTGVPLGFTSQKLLISKNLPVAKKPEPAPLGYFNFLFFTGFVVGCVGPGLIMSTLGFILKNQVGETLTILTIVIGIATINGLLLSTQSIINTLGAPFIGTFLDWFGHRRGALMFLSAATCALFGAVVANHVFLLMLLILVFFICEAAVPIMLSVRAGRNGPKTFAAFATSGDLGAALGPIIGWTVFEFVLLPRITFVIGGLLYTVATILSFREFTKNR